MTTIQENEARWNTEMKMLHSLEPFLKADSSSIETEHGTFNITCYTDKELQDERGPSTFKIYDDYGGENTVSNEDYENAPTNYPSQEALVFKVSSNQALLHDDDQYPYSGEYVSVSWKELEHDYGVSKEFYETQKAFHEELEKPHTVFDVIKTCYEQVHAQGQVQEDYSMDFSMEYTQPEQVMVNKPSTTNEWHFADASQNNQRNQSNDWSMS